MENVIDFTWKAELSYTPNCSKFVDKTILATSSMHSNLHFTKNKQFKLYAPEFKLTSMKWICKITCVSGNY